MTFRGKMSKMSKEIFQNNMINYMNDLGVQKIMAF